MAKFSARLIQRKPMRRLLGVARLVFGEGDDRRTRTGFDGCLPIYDAAGRSAQLGGLAVDLDRDDLAVIV